MNLNVTQDGLLDRRITLNQPRHGYRAGDDAVLLAAAVGARPGQTVLDAGAGVGAVSLCLAWRCPELVIRGMELQPELATLAQENIAANGMAARGSIQQGDIRRSMWRADPLPHPMPARPSPMARGKRPCKNGWHFVCAVLYRVVLSR